LAGRFQRAIYPAVYAAIDFRFIFAYHFFSLCPAGQTSWTL